MAIDGDLLQAMNDEVGRWARGTASKMKQRLAAEGLDSRRAKQRGSSRLRIARSSSGATKLVQEVPLIESIRSALKFDNQLLDSIAFRFSRHGIFLELGVGKNRPKGSSSASATATPWLAPTLNAEIETLADILANNYADIAAGEVRILIPGIFDTRITI